MALPQGDSAEETQAFTFLFVFFSVTFQVSQSLPKNYRGCKAHSYHSKPGVWWETVGPALLLVQDMRLWQYQLLVSLGLD